MWLTTIGTMCDEELMENRGEPPLEVLDTLQRAMHVAG